jgi:cell wall-associated NlpC family hydrolase
MTWTRNYVGLPFLRNGRNRDGLDCWGLVHLVYREVLGVNLPFFNDVFADNKAETYIRIGHIMREQREFWSNPSTQKPFDIVHLRTGRHAFHVGIAVDEHQFLHVDEGVDSVIESFRCPLWRNRLDWIYRYKPTQCQ